MPAENREREMKSKESFQSEAELQKLVVEWQTQLKTKQKYLAAFDVITARISTGGWRVFM